MKIFKLYYFFPIFLITGPFLPDLMVSTSSLFFLYYFYKNEKDYLKINFFYLFIIINLVFIISSLNSYNLIFSLKSSLPYLRIFIFPIIIYYLLEKKIINLNVCFKILITVVLFLSLDGLFQFLYGVNILGFKSPLNYRVTGFFGDEAILGSYLSKIIPLIISIYIFLNYKKDEKINVVFLITIFFGILCIFLSGDRMPFGTIILYLLLINLFSFNLKKFIASSFLVFFILTLLFSNNLLKNRYINMTLLQLFEKDITEINQEKNYIDQDNIKKKINFDYSNILNSKILFFSKSHNEHFKSAYSIFKKNKIIGSGPNTFRINCYPKFYEHSHKCSSHPHNIYLQLLAEVGIVGILILLSFLIFFIYKVFEGVKLRNKSQIYIFIHLFVMIFPISTYGNFFNNFNSIILFYPIGFYIYILSKSNYKSK